MNVRAEIPYPFETRTFILSRPADNPPSEEDQEIEREEAARLASLPFEVRRRLLRRFAEDAK